MRTIRRLIAVTALAAGLFGGMSAAADAGEICVRVRTPAPLSSPHVCLPTNV